MDNNQAMDTQLRPAFSDGCALDATELDERLAEIDRLTASSLVDRYDAAGEIVLSFDRGAAAQVHDLVRRERECCAHLEFAVEEAEDVIRVAIRPRPAASPNACCPACG